VYFRYKASTPKGDLDWSQTVNALIK
jgi:hypothetical protein